jgi:membrane protein required for colicin V production
MRFNILDGVIVVLLLLSVYFGYRAGPLKKFITLLAAIVGVAAGVRLMNPVGGILARLGVFSIGFSYALAFVLLVAVVLVGTYFLYHRFGKKTSAKKPGRIAAAVLGLLESAFLISVVLLMLKLFDLPGTSLRSGSLLYRPMLNLAPVSFDALRTVVPGGGEIRNGLSGEHPDQP